MRPRTGSLTVSVGLVSLLIILWAFGPSPAWGDAACGDWSLVQTPTPGAGNHILQSVTVVSSNNVFAIGYNTTAIQWDGTGWNEVSFPDLSGIGSSFVVDDASASPNGDIWVTGAITLSTFHAAPLVMRYHTDWDFMEAVVLKPQSVEPFAPRSGRAGAVDALATDDVWAVGFATGDGDGVGGPRPLTIHWDGSDWLEVDAPAVGDRINDLYDVAMIASNDVWAVGRWRDICCQSVALTLHWDGSNWNHVANPAESIGGTELKAVTAIASDDIWAVGWRPSDALLMHWDGSDWTVFDSPVPVTFGMSAVAAIGPNDVWAAGGNLIDSYLHWDGSAWSVIPASPVPGATSSTRGGGLAVVGPCDVWSVGRYMVDTATFNLSERLQPTTTGIGPDRNSDAGLTIAAPNPYVPGGEIVLSTKVGGEIRVIVYDILGRVVWNRGLGHRSPGAYVIRWSGRDDAGTNVAPGVYFLRMETGSLSVDQRLVVLH